MSMWLGPPAKQTMITDRGDEALRASACSRKISGKVKPPKPRPPTRKKPRRLKLAAVGFLPLQKVNMLGASLSVTVSPKERSPGWDRGPWQATLTLVHR
jgi:hypothetical protein